MIRRLCLLICTAILISLPIHAERSVHAQEMAGDPDEQTVIDTGLPVVYLSLDNGQEITDREHWKDGVMRIRNTEDYSACTNRYTEEGGGIRLKGRGNSTWWQFSTQKRAYSLKLDEKAKLFGMDASKNWILLANFMDRSNLRNKFAYDLSGRLGMTFCDSSFVNLYLNGRYQGVYQLCQKPDAPIDHWEDLGETLAEAIALSHSLSDVKAANLKALCKTDLNWMSCAPGEKYHGYVVSDYIDLSARKLYGNYLIEYDYYFDEPSKFHTALGVPLNIRSPEQLASNSSAMDALRDRIQDFEDALRSPTFCNSKGAHYSSYVDMDSLVDYYIVNAFIKNVEFGYKSMFLYLDGEGILHFGPCWDYDWSSANHFLGAAPNPEAWYDDGRANTNTWYRLLYSDPYFVARVQERWFEVQSVIQEEIDRLAQWEAYLSAASDLEQAVYLALPHENDYRNQYHGYSFADEVDAFRIFLTRRMDWMNEQFAKKKPNIEGLGPKSQLALGLTLTDASGTLDVPLNPPFPIKWATDGTTVLTVHTNQPFSRLVLNGYLIAANRDECAITPEYLRAGVNVLIAWVDTDSGYRMESVCFVTPREDAEFVDIGRDTVRPAPGKTVIYQELPAEPLPPPVTGSDKRLWMAAGLSSLLLLAGGGISSALLLRKKKD